MKMLVFGMGALIIVLLAVVIGTLVGRMIGGGSAGGGAPAEALALPEGARIAGFETASGRLHLLLDLADGGQSLVMVEAGRLVPVVTTGGPAAAPVVTP